MFESVLFRSPSLPGPLVDAGLIAESLLFYGRVDVVGNTGIVKELLRAIPPLIVLRLLEQGRLRVYHIQHQLAVASSGDWPGVTTHSLVKASAVDDTTDRMAPSVFRQAAGDTSQAKLAASKFGELVRPIGFDMFDRGHFFQDLIRSAETDTHVTGLLSILAPEYDQGDAIRFRVEGGPGRFRVDTNLVFDRLNRVYHRRIPASHSTVTPASIVAHLQLVHEDLFFAAALKSELISDAVGTAINGRRLRQALQSQLRSEEQLATFSNLVLKDAHAIRHAVNSGQVSFAQVLRVVERGERFRKWLSSHPPTLDLVQEYYDKTVESTWVEKLPVKSVRFAFFAGAGIAIDAMGGGGIGTAASVGLSAADAFLLDSLAKGWKPSHFVEEHLRPAFAAPLPVTARSRNDYRTKWPGQSP